MYFLKSIYSRNNIAAEIETNEALEMQSKE